MVNDLELVSERSVNSRSLTPKGENGFKIHWRFIR